MIQLCNVALYTVIQLCNVNQQNAHCQINVLFQFFLSSTYFKHLMFIIRKTLKKEDLNVYAVLYCVLSIHLCQQTGRLQYVAVCCSMLQYVAVCCIMLQYVAVCCSILHYVAVCCSMLQYVL